MKHNLKVTLLMVLFFIIAQLFGLFVLSRDAEISLEEGRLKVSHGDTVLGTRPDIRDAQAFLYIGSAILIGTVLLLLLIRLKKIMIWRIWFFLAVWLAMTLTIGVFFSSMIAYSAAFILALVKILKPNFFTHNLTELLMYSGIALLLVPMLSLLWASIVLVAISAYDMYAVWKSKHMVKLAKFQSKANLFAGFFLPYKQKKAGKAKGKKVLVKKGEEMRTAILGGGDIAFPMIFAGVVMESIVASHQIAITAAFMYSTIITLFAGLALLGLFIYSKKGKYYPAMPFISAGCFVGCLVIYLII